MVLPLSVDTIDQRCKEEGIFSGITFPERLCIFVLGYQVHLMIHNISGRIANKPLFILIHHIFQPVRIIRKTAASIRTIYAERTVSTESKESLLVGGITRFYGANFLENIIMCFVLIRKDSFTVIGCGFTE